MLPQFQNLDLRPRSPRNESVLRGSWHRLRGRCVVVLFLLLLFMFRHLLLFVLFFVFLAALVSHACSFSDCDLKSGSLRRKSSLPSSRSGRVTAAEPRFLVSLHVQFFVTPRPRVRLIRQRDEQSACGLRYTVASDFRQAGSNPHEREVANSWM
jgi:hypothetical protein